MTSGWRIALFAGLAETFGTRNFEADWTEERLKAKEVKERLMALYPERADLVSVSFMACNHAFVGDEESIGREDELALLPPVSGGDSGVGDSARAEAERYRIVATAIDTNEVIRLASHPDHGATLAFVGTTREWTGGLRTIKLEYEAYVPMAEKALRDIGNEIGERWPGSLVAIAHRIGEVGIGEASVVIAVSSPHRAAAYEASRYAIERLKAVVPIWKKEVYEDGTEWKGHQSGPWNPLTEPGPFS